MATLFERTVMEWAGPFQKELEIKGFQSDGAFGNGGAESAGFAAFQEAKPISGRGGAGGWQWTGSRRVDFEQWCANNKLDPHDVDSSCKYFIHDLKTNFPKVLENLRATRTRDDAVRVIMNQYEKPYDSQHRAENPTAYQRNLDARIRWAERAEKARLLKEGETTMPDLTHEPTAQEIAEALAANQAAMARLEAKLEDFAIGQLSSHGVPPFVVAGLSLLLKQIDFAALVRRVDWASIVRHILESFGLKPPFVDQIITLLEHINYGPLFEKIESITGGKPNV